MRRTGFFVRIILLAVFAMSALPLVRAADLASQITFSAAEKQTLHDALDKRWKQMVDVPTPTAAGRDLLEMLLDAVGTEWHPERWDRILEVASQMQPRDLSADRYHDIFGIQRAVVCAMFYGDRLSPASKTLLTSMCQKAVEPTRTSKIEPAHTNMAVAKAWDLIALGEYLNDPKLAGVGYDFLKEWIVFTKANGLSEYNSPTYSLADLGSLSLISQFAARPEGREDARAGLEFMWSEVVANWFAPGGRLGGAHSRNYHPLKSEGVISMAMNLPTGEDIEGDVVQGVYFKALRLPPPDIKAEECQVVPRVVAQKWGTAPGQYATHYVGTNFSIGASGASYSYQDTPLSLTWAGGPNLPGGYFVMDGRGDPYGGKKVATRKDGSHEKIVHLIPELMSVQRGGDVLLLAWIDLEKTQISYQQVDELASNLILPVMDDVWAGDKKLSLKENDFVALPDGVPLVGKRKDVIMGARVLYATNLDGQPSKTGIFADGLKSGAFRLASIGSEKPATKGKVQIVLWVRMAEGPDADDASRFEQNFAQAVAKVERTGDTLTVTATGVDGDMKLSANLVTNERLVCEGGDPKALASLLWVNGIDIGARILDAAPAIKQNNSK